MELTFQRATGCKTGCSAQNKNLSQSFTIRIWKVRVCMSLLETRSGLPIVPNWEKLDNLDVVFEPDFHPICISTVVKLFRVWQHGWPRRGLQ